MIVASWRLLVAFRRRCHAGVTPPSGQPASCPGSASSVEDISEHVVAILAMPVFILALQPIVLMESFILSFCLAKACSTADLHASRLGGHSPRPYHRGEETDETCEVDRPAFVRGCEAAKMLHAAKQRSMRLRCLDAISVFGMMILRDRFDGMMTSAPKAVILSRKALLS